MAVDTEIVDTLPWPFLFEGSARPLWKASRAGSRRVARARIELIVRGKSGRPARAKTVRQAFGVVPPLILFEGRTGPSSRTPEANEAVVAGTRAAVHSAGRWLQAQPRQAFERMRRAGHSLELSIALRGGGDQHEVLWRALPSTVADLCERRGVRVAWTGDVSPHRFTPLYCAYNGFMLGAFLAELLADYERVKRDRVQDFLRELGIPLLLPRTRKRYREAYGVLELDLKRRLQVRSAELRAYFDLGVAAAGRGIVHVGPKSGRRHFETMARRAMKDLGVPYRLFRAYLQTLDALEQTGYRKQAFYTLALGFLRAVIERLPADPGTGFVAMPFRGRFRRYFDTFYRPIAGHCELALVRAWGDLWKEDHQELLMMMISKAEMLLADLTGLNRNVLFEVGFGLGAGKKTLFIQEGVVRNPANIRMDWVYRYSTEKKGSREYQARAAGLWYTALSATRAPGSVPSWHADPLRVLQLLAGIAAASKRPGGRRR